MPVNCKGHIRVNISQSLVIKSQVRVRFTGHVSHHFVVEEGWGKMITFLVQIYIYKGYSCKIWINPVPEQHSMHIYMCVQNWKVEERWTFLSLEAVKKNCSSWLQAQAQMILEWLVVFLSTKPTRENVPSAWNYNQSRHRKRYQRHANNPW